MKLDQSFFLRDNVVQIAEELLGKVIITNINGQKVSAMITETEAYAGITDRASHAFNGRKTKRNSVMYENGGVAYVYLCYGIHHLFNFVTNHENIPDAILLRGIMPLTGLALMGKRRSLMISDKGFSDGPGKVSQALGIKVIHSGLSLTSKDIWVEDDGKILNDYKINAGPRIGVDYAGEDARLPYRFILTKK
jgi:DNA-3-methyladenine glycosylase